MRPARQGILNYALSTLCAVRVESFSALQGVVVGRRPSLGVVGVAATGSPGNVSISVRRLSGRSGGEAFAADNSSEASMTAPPSFGTPRVLPEASPSSRHRIRASFDGSEECEHHGGLSRSRRGLLGPAGIQMHPPSRQRLRCRGSSNNSSSRASSSSPRRVSITTAAAGSILSDGDDVELVGTEWPAPHPAQAFVTHSRDGRPYELGSGLRSAEGVPTRIRMVVADLDGTLLGPDKRVSARTLEAVRRVRANGIIFVPASGRSKGGMFSAMEELGEELRRDGAPFVCMNGLTVYGQGDGCHGEIIYSEDMSAELAARVVGFWRSHPLAAAAGVSLCGSEGDTVVVERLDERTRGYTNCLEPLPKEVGDMMDAIDAGMKLNRLFFWGETRAAVDSFKEDLAEHLKDHPAELTRGVPEMIEVLPPEASKAVGLRALLKEMSISPDEVIAIGDEDNDVEMLRAVGHGIAMGQASLAVRRASRYTAPSNALHGVAVAMEAFCGV